MKPLHASRVLAQMALGLGLLSASPCTWTAESFTAISGSEKPVKAKKPKSAKPPTDKGTGENKAERDKRLLRECRGKANAGACEGYAS